MALFFLKCCSSCCCYHFINFFSIWINCFKCSWYISDITQFFVNFKSSSISQLINVKSRDLHKSYSNILMEQQLLCLIYIIVWCTSYYFCLILKRFTGCYIVVYPIIIIIIFSCIIIYLISIIIPQTSLCRRIIVTIL